MMTTIQRQIQQEINLLPQEAQNEVFRFILKLKTQQCPPLQKNHTQTTLHELDRIGIILSEKWNPNISATQIISDLRR